ncbi:MAG TPA: exodeoxyribonuclease V subunit alpha, partial [Desulfobacteraceae bacterium]|nr:exodeoxyribonuclease V subunit alpha [Desulfobacteraceae bacterium]
MRALLEQAAARGQLRQIDLHVALFLEKLAGGDSPGLLLAAALASRAVGEGHICLPLDHVAGKPVLAPEPICKAPELSTWRGQLLASGVV